MLVLSLADWQNGNNNQNGTHANCSWNCRQQGEEAISPAARGASIRHAYRLHHATDYATVLFPLPGISNDLEVVRLL